MSVRLFPRLTALGTSVVLDSFGTTMVSPERARAIVSDRAAMVSYGSSGGSRADDAALQIAEQLRAIAVDCGFPDNQSQVAKSKFDRDATIALATSPHLTSGEALRDDVWAYMATVRLPDIVAWRFPELGHHRFAGGVRNTFQRLWVRGATLDRGEDHTDRWALVRFITEDAAVQIFERPSVGGSPPIARAVAEGWVEFATRVGRKGMEPIMRKAVKLLRLRNEVVDVGGLPADERQALVLSCFEAASSAGSHG
jgi:hypothetical protein